MSEQRSSDLRQRRHHALEPGLEAGAQVRADVETTPSASIAHAASMVERIVVDALLVELVVRAREVDEVERVDEHAADPELLPPLPECGEVLRVVIGEPPRPRALHEELERVELELGGAVERLLDPAGAVSAEEHASYATEGVPSALSRALRPGDRRAAIRCCLSVGSTEHIRRARGAGSPALGRGMSVRVRMAPSPTGLPAHRRRAHVPLQLAVRPRRGGGECLLRIENTDTSREVAEATEQIQRSLAWLGIDWDGPVTFQLDAMDRCRELAQRLARGGQGLRGRGRDPLPDARRGRDRVGRRRAAAGSSSRTSSSRTS